MVQLNQATPKTQLWVCVCVWGGVGWSPALEARKSFGYLKNLREMR